jgi:hypothetical protein
LGFIGIRALCEENLKASPIMVKLAMKCIITCESLTNFVLFSKGRNPLARLYENWVGFLENVKHMCNQKEKVQNQTTH